MANKSHLISKPISDKSYTNDRRKADREENTVFGIVENGSQQRSFCNCIAFDANRVWNRQKQRKIKYEYLFRCKESRRKILWYSCVPRQLKSMNSRIFLFMAKRWKKKSNSNKCNESKSIGFDISIQQNTHTIVFFFFFTVLKRERFFFWYIILYLKQRIIESQAQSNKKNVVFSFRFTPSRVSTALDLSIYLKCGICFILFLRIFVMCFVSAVVYFCISAQHFLRLH